MNNKKQEVIDVFQRLYKDPISLDEANEANSNLFGFLNLLCEIDKQLKN